MVELIHSRVVYPWFAWTTSSSWLLCDPIIKSNVCPHAGESISNVKEELKELCYTIPACNIQHFCTVNILPTVNYEWPHCFQNFIFIFNTFICFTFTYCISKEILFTKNKNIISNKIWNEKENVFKGSDFIVV